MARTQQQRREETVARLLSACIDTIIEVGYARASAVVITKRAKLSDGALFRHFATMSDFMAATAREALRRQLELFSRRAGKLRAGDGRFEAVLSLLREVTSNPTNAVVYELLIAARTDDNLRRTLRIVLGDFRLKLYEVAREMPGAAHFPAPTFPLLLQTLLNIFDGAAILRPVLPSPETEALQVPFLAALLGPARATAKRKPPKRKVSQ
jgi:AcrR family transcriptional regulator